MKKIFLILAVVFGMTTTVACNSCTKDNDTTMDLVYDVTATADGQVSFTWPNGGANVNGDAVVFQCNDTTKSAVALTDEVRELAVPLSEALQSNSETVVDAAQSVASMFTVNGVEGQYHLSIVGYVKYGPMAFMIDEHWPPINPTDSTRVE